MVDNQARVEVVDNQPRPASALMVDNQARVVVVDNQPGGRGYV